VLLLNELFIAAVYFITDSVRKVFDTHLYVTLAQLTPWSRVLLEKLTVAHIVKFSACYTNGNFIRMFTRARHWFLS